MRKLAMVAAAALLAACGDGGGDGGGGGGTTDVTLAGPLAATIRSGAYAPFSGTCTVGPASLAFAGAFVAVSTAPNQCTEAVAGREVAGSTSLFISLAKVALTGTSTALDNATYPLFTGGLPSFDAQGNARFSTVAAQRNGASAAPGLGCTKVAEPVATAASVTVTSVSTSRIAGSVTATLDDGTTVSGTFDVSTCGLTISVDPATCEPTGLPNPTTCTP